MEQLQMQSIQAPSVSASNAVSSCAIGDMIFKNGINSW